MKGTILKWYFNITLNNKNRNKIPKQVKSKTQYEHPYSGIRAIIH